MCLYLWPQACEGPPAWLVRYHCNAGHEFVALACRGHLRDLASGMGPPNVCGHTCPSNEISMVTVPLNELDA